MPRPLPTRLLIPLAALVLLGVAAFLFDVFYATGVQAWLIFQVNFLFWSGLAQGLVVVAALMQITKARWAGPIRPMAEAGAAFLPVSFFLFWLIYFGRETLFSWIQHPVEGKVAWLNVPFLFARDGLGLFALFGVSLLFVLHSHRARSGAGPKAERSRRALSQITPALLILYAFVWSLIAFDLAMSLDPHWYSNIYGAYVFVGNIFVALAMLAVAAVLLRNTLGLGEQITPARLHDLGKLLFGFCLFWAGLLWSHFLPIWYGNLPEETGHVLTRIDVAPWAAMSWAVLVLGFVLPFTALLSRGVKKNPRALASISGVAVIGIWLERYLLIAPSLVDVEAVSGIYEFTHNGQFAFVALEFDWGIGFPFVGVVECLVTLGFFAAFTLCYLFFLHRFPPDAKAG